MEHCQFCDNKFTLRKNLYRHVRKVHKCEPEFPKSKKIKSNLICPKCKERHGLYKDLRDHLSVQHNVAITSEVVTFSSKKAFLEWKQNKEREIKCFYKKSTGTKGDRSYYVCHRSYVEKDKRHQQLSQNKRRNIKSQGYSKLSHTCPSTIQLRKKGEEFRAIIHLPHIGHICSLKHINLTLEERTQIAEKIAAGVSFQTILDHVRSNIQTGETLSRLHLLDRQDLRNITKEFSLNSQKQYHKNDEVSVPICVDMMKEVKDESLVLYFEPQEEEDESGALVHDHMHKRVKKNIKRNNTNRINLIQQTHKKVAEFRVGDICKISDENWKVKSGLGGNIEYMVEKVDNSHGSINSECELFCNACKICVHDFCCSCPDNSIRLNICKHIHAVIHFDMFNRLSQKSEKLEESNSVLENVLEHDIYQTMRKDKNKRIKLKLDQLYALTSRSKPRDEVYQKIEKYLDNCINLLNPPHIYFKAIPGNFEKQAIRESMSIGIKIKHDHDYFAKTEGYPDDLPEI